MKNRSFRPTGARKFSLPGRFFLLFLLSLNIAACGAFDKEVFRPPEGDGPSVLVDLYHTRIQNHEDYQLKKGDYNYQGVFGYHRAFQHLDEQGYEIRSIRKTKLSKARLADFDVLFINLVHDQRPNFSGAEYEAIDEWIKAGGGLFLIADHTNVYRSAERINPILAPMDMEVGYHTLVEDSPAHTITGSAWLMLWDFDPHFITEGVEMISPQTGGPIFGDFGLAWTSDQSFADYWDEEEESGFYGNWRFDGDEILEPKGPLALVAAREYGEGRVVVVGDQNLFGDAWLHFGDNFDLMMNSFQWLAGQEDAPLLREQKPRNFQIGLDMAHNDFAPGRNYEDAYYVHFVHYNRDPEVTARARTRLEPDNDALILLDPNDEFEPQDLEIIKGYFRAGKTVVLSLNADKIRPGALSLLGEIAPDFSFNINTIDGDKETISLPSGSIDAPLELPAARLEGHHALRSDEVEVAGLKLASAPREVEPLPGGLSPYLLAVSSDWGAPLVQAEVDESSARGALASGRVDIARVKQVQNGQLLVLLQDGFFRNRTLGTREVIQPDEAYMDAVEFQYRLLDWLKAQAPR